MNLWRRGDSLRKNVSRLLLLFFVSSLLPLQPFATSPASAEIENIFTPWDGSIPTFKPHPSIPGNLNIGKGTASNPYIISNAKQLAFLTHNMTQSSPHSIIHDLDIKHYKLSGDIDLNEKEWYPIGTSAYPFKGVFDGNGFTVKNLKITSSDLAIQEVGLFGNVQNATIKNLAVRGVSFDVRGPIGIWSVDAGAIAGSSMGGSTISNCYALDVNIKAGAVDTTVRAGGIIGLLGDNDSMSNCYTAGRVESFTDMMSPAAGNGAVTGGVVGTSNAYNAIHGCYSTATVRSCNDSGIATAGGVFGYTIDPVEAVYSTGDIYAESGAGHAFSGGIAGQSEAGIACAFSTGGIFANSPSNSYAGGIVGDIDGISYGEAQITHSYATGNIRATTTIDDTATTRAGGIAGFNGEDAQISKTYSTGDIFADGAGKYEQYDDDTTTAGGISSHTLGSIVDNYAYGNIDAKEQAYAHRGGIAAFVYSHFALSRIENNAWRNGTGQNPALSQDVGEIYHANPSNTTVRNNVSFDINAFKVKSNFTQIPLNWNFEPAGDWCYTNLDGKAKPHLRAFFKEDGKEELNTISPDLVWIGPPALCVTSNDVETTRMVAGEYMPDEDSMRFWGLPRGIGVTISQSVTSPDVIVVSCDADVAGWIGEIGVDYTVNGHRQPEKTFILRVYATVTTCPLQKALDVLSPDLAVEGQYVAILSQSTIPSGLGNVITVTKCGDATFTLVPSVDLVSRDGLLAPFPSFTSDVGLGNFTDGDLLALSYDLTLISLDAFAEWGAMSEAKRLDRLVSDGSIIAFGNATGLVGSGGTISWKQALDAGIVSFTDKGISFHYVMTDEMGNSATSGSVLKIPDGTPNQRIEGEPVYFLTKNADYNDEGPGPGPGPVRPPVDGGSDGGSSGGKPNDKTPGIFVESQGETITSDGGDMKTEFPIWGQGSGGDTVVPEDVRVTVPDNWHESGLAFKVEDDKLVIYGQPHEDGTYELVISAIVDGVAVSTTLTIEVIAANVLHVTVVSINSDDWRAALTPSTERGSDEELLKMRISTRWRSGVSIGYHAKEQAVKVYASGLSNASAWIEDASGDILASADVADAEVSARRALGLETELVRHLVVEGMVASQHHLPAISVKTVTFTDDTGKSYRQNLDPPISFSLGSNATLDNTGGGGGDASSGGDNDGGGGCSATPFAWFTIALLPLLYFRRRGKNIR